MDALVSTVAAAVGMFAGTNVDDLVVLTVLFLSARATGRPRPWQIWSGQYAGIAVLVVVSALAALGLAAVPDRWVGLLGLVPIALGVKGLVTTIRQPLTDLYQDRLRGYPLRPRRTFTDRVARQIGEHLPTLVIEAQRPRSTVEPDILQIPQQRVHRRRPWRGRLVDNIAFLARHHPAHPAPGVAGFDVAWGTGVSTRSIHASNRWPCG